MIDLFSVSQAALGMQPLPTSTIRLATLATAPAPDLPAIIEVVRYDQALTAALLRTANSSWSAPRTPITNVADAVVRLGTGLVLTVALGVNLRGRMTTRLPEYGLDEGELWRHSVAASLAAETLMRHTSQRLPAETPTAALLHDVGKLVMSRFLDPLQLRAIEDARAVGVSWSSAEVELLGVDHAELGGLIAQAWELPDALVTGITYHHTPERSVGLLAYSVYLSDVIAKQAAGANDTDRDVERFARAVGEIGLTADKYDEVCRLVAERLAEVTERFN